MNDELNRAEKQFEMGNMKACFKIVNDIIDAENKNIKALMLRARLNYNWQNWGNSLNDLNKILEIDVNNEFAKNYKQIVLNILSYWNKDSYNP